MAKKTPVTGEPKGYAEAMREIEEILAELDTSSIDVDVLATKVERASFLVTWCSDRIGEAEFAVKALVESLDVDVDLDDGEDDEFDDEEFDEDNDDQDYDDQEDDEVE